MFADAFREAMSDVADAINDEMGETVIITPYVEAQPNFPASPDPTLPAFSVTAVFSHMAVMTFGTPIGHRKAIGGGDYLEAGVSTRRPIFSIKSCDLPYPLYGGTRIQRCHDGSIWEITDAKPDGISRVQINVVQLGRDAQLDRPMVA